MSNTLDLIAEHLLEVTPADIKRRFRAVEIRDADAFAAELKQYVIDNVRVVVRTLPSGLFYEDASSKTPTRRGHVFSSTLPDESLHRSLSEKANALIAKTLWEPTETDIQRGRKMIMDAFYAPSNLSVVAFSKLAGKGRQQIYEDIKARRLLTIRVSAKKQALPEWQLESAKMALTRAVLNAALDVDDWTIYQALSDPLEALGGHAPVEVVEPTSVGKITQTVLNVLGIIPEDEYK